MAEIYLAQPVGDEETLVVLKRLKNNFLAHDKAIRLFFAESRLITQMSHPYIVRGFEFISENENKFIVMEYIVGRSVRHFAYQDLNFDFRMHLALVVGIEVSEALIYAYNFKGEDGQQLRLVHKDISPQNIIVSSKGCIKIIDFGVAQTSLHQGENDEILHGNLFFMSPEQQRGEQLSQASDVYSLALVMLEVLSGKKCCGYDENQVLPAFLLKDENGQKLFNLLKKALAHEVSNRIDECEKFVKHLYKIKKTLGIDEKNILKQSLYHSLVQQKDEKNIFVLLKSRIRKIALFTAALFAAVFVFFVFVDGLLREKSFIVSPVVQYTPFKPIEKNKFSSFKNSNLRATGKLKVLVHPWTEVYIDEEFLGITPMSDIYLPPGDYIVRLQNHNYSSIALRKVRIYAERESELVHNF
ncbi:MAG: protein kinase [Myxococcales bacterium]|nr:protein kinase [Myxococcales bacterium]USN50682.1 MAG: protein kinase [Myxococcales bacterium]